MAPNFFVIDIDNLCDPTSPPNSQEILNIISLLNIYHPSGPNFKGRAILCDKPLVGFVYNARDHRSILMFLYDSVLNIL